MERLCTFYGVPSGAMWPQNCAVCGQEPSGNGVFVENVYHHSHCYYERKREQDMAALLKRVADVLERIERKLDATHGTAGGCS